MQVIKTLCSTLQVVEVLWIKWILSGYVDQCALVCVHLSVCLHLCPLQLMQHSSTAVLWEPDLLQVMEAVERRGVKELSQEAAHALRLLLTQVHQFTHPHIHTDNIM